MKHAAKATEKKTKLKRQNAKLFTFYFSLFTFFSASVQAVVLPKTAKLIPPETVLLVDVDNFSQLKTQFEKTNLYKLYKDPAIVAFVEDFKTKWREKIRQSEDKILKAIVDADVLPEGRVALALVLNEQTKDNEPPFLLISQWGKNTSKIKEAVDKMVKKAIEDGSHRKTEDYRGVTIVTMIKESESVKVPDFSKYKPDQNDVPMKTMQPPPTETHHCFIDDCLIASMNLDVLKFVIAHVKGAGSPTLADDTDYTATIGATGPYHDIDFYVNIKQIIKTIVAEDSTGKSRSSIANLGLGNVASAGSSIGLGRGGSSCHGKTFFKIDGPKKGIFKMLDLESGLLRTPRFISASTYSIAFLNLNIRRAYDELYNILYSFNPEYAAIMLVPLLPPGPDGQPGVELKGDIINHLGSQIVIAQSVNKPFSSGSTPKESLVAVAVNDRRALEKSLQLFHSKVIAPNNPDARRELLGHTIYLLTMPPLPFFPTGVTPMQSPAELSTPPLPKLALTVTDTHLILGTESTVERAIRTLSSPAAPSVGSATWFTSAKLAVPSLVGLAWLEDSAVSSEILWWMTKQGHKPEASLSLGLGLQGFGELINPTLLPEFDTVRKYFGLSTFYGASRPDGFFFEFKYLK